MTTQFSDQLYGVNLRNPFTAIQARDVAGNDLVAQFQPSSFYYSRFNDNNEIIFGARGSGKTIQLRMMSYSLYRSRKEEFHLARDDHKYFGVYIPLRLGLMNEIDVLNGETSRKTQYFSFCVNCIAAASFLREVEAITLDLIPDDLDRLVAHRDIVKNACRAWGITYRESFNSIGSIVLELDRIYLETVPWLNSESGGDNNKLAHTPLFPLIEIAKWVTGRIGLNVEKVTWVATFDEAEFLKEPFQEVFNALLRSEKRPFSVKIATLPFRWTTFRAAANGEVALPNNGDISCVEMRDAWNSIAFRDLSDGILSQRLKSLGLYSDFEFVSLSEFLSPKADMGLIDRYKIEFPEDSMEALDAKVIEALSKKRQKTFHNSASDKAKKATLKRYRPIFIIRELYKKSRKGRSTPALLSGSDMVRRISEGNPRSFIQILDRLYERAQETKLKVKEQHRVLLDYCERIDEFASYIPFYSDKVIEIIDGLSDHLSKKFHGETMIDVGVEFFLGSLRDDPIVVPAIKEAIAHSYLYCDDDSVIKGITGDSVFRLSSVTASRKWLHMRAGEGVSLLSAISPSPDDVESSRPLPGGLQQPSLFEFDED